MFRKLTYLISIALALGTTGTRAAGDVDPTLFGWWKFEEAGGTLFDQSSNHNDGTSVNGVLYQQAGYVGYALGFDGIDDHVTVGTTGRPTDTFSFGAWLKTSSTHEIDTQATSGYGGVNNQRYAFDPRHGGDQNAGAGLSVGTNGVAVYEHGSDYMPATAAYPTELGDDWNHIMIVYISKQPTIYLNGRAVHTGFKSPRAIVYAPIQFGGMAYGYFEGLMDEVRIYNRALSAAEIRKLAARQRAWSPTPPDGALHLDTWVSLSWMPGDFAVSHDVYLSDSFESVRDGTGDAFRGNQTATFYVAGFPGFAYPDGLVPGTTYCWRIDVVNDADPNSPWRGPVWSFSIPPKTAYNPKPTDGAEFVALDSKLSWTAGFGAKLHTVYFGDNFETVSNATGGLPQGTTTYTPSALQAEKVYYWRVDEFDAVATHKGDIWGFTTPGAAGSPQPANRATGVQMVTKLSWTPATKATSHQVYFGMDKDAVRSATTASPEYKGSKALGDETLDPGKLAWHSDYYWRVDAVYNTGAVKGLVWSFTTADFLLVDDFESYNDIDPPDPASNRIFDNWIDGFGTTNNGALVGNDMPPYAERTVVHGGAQSMPYSYDNNLKTSEATLTLVYPRDWTEEGVTKLSLWFRGTSANAAERMYIALNGSAVVYHDNPAVTQKTGWNQWVIDLQMFRGVTLTNVNTITIGFGTKNSPAAGGSGKMYFDDIRLYR